jgi:hypothetical protein
MASYMMMGGISPSRRLTELLSAYLDFDDDPSHNNAGASASNTAAAAGGASSSGSDNKKKGTKRQFNLGLWGGDLSLHDVALRRDAIEPLLNELLMNGSSGGGSGSSASSSVGSSGNASAGTKRPRPNSKSKSNLDLSPFDPLPLQLALIKGTIGHLRLAVPWKQLVMGGVSTTSSSSGRKSDSPVEIVVEDVTIVFGLKSSGGGRDRDSDAGAKDSKVGKDPKKRGGGNGGDDASRDERARRQRLREEKQRRIAEAERLHLCGLDLPAPDDHAAWGRDEEGRRLDSDDADSAGDGLDGAGAAAAVSSEANTGESSSTSTSSTASAGMIHRLLQSAKSSLAWRLVTNLRARVRNLRIVVIVDGVEVGLTIDSHDVEYWSEGTGSGSDGDGTKTNGNDVAAFSTAGDAASEHAGDGVNSEVPSVVIRGPPGRIVRQQRTPADASTAPLTIDSATLAAGDTRRSGTAGMASSSSSPDESFGKIVKIRGLGVYVRPTTASTVRLMKQQQRQGLGRAGALAGAGAGTVIPTLPPLPRPFPDDYLIKPTMADVTVKLLRNAASASTGGVTDEQAPMQQDGGSSEEPPPKKRRGKRQKRARPSAATPAQEAPSTTGGINSAVGVVPGASAEFTFGGGGNDARVSSNERISSIAGGSATSSAPSTLLSGKPSGHTPQLVVGVRVGQIRTVCCTRQHALLHSFAHGATRIRNGRPEETIRSQLPRRSSADRRVGAPPRGAGLGLPSAADRKSVVRAWWHYACGHVGRGVNRRLTMRDMFKAGPALFDWDEQSHMREEYIAVYTKLRLGRRALASFPAGDDGADSADDTNTEHGIAPDQDGLHSGEGLDDMLRIEDELSIEQILLYRSIARSAKIGGSSRVKVRGRPTSSLGRRTVGGIGSRSTIARPTRLSSIDRRKTCSPALATPTRGTSSSNSISTPASSLKDYRVESKSSVQRKRHRYSHTSLDLSGISSSLSGFNASDTNSNDGQSSRRSSAFDGDDDGIGRGDDQSLAVSLSRPSLHRSLSDRRMSSSVVASRRGTTRTAMELAAVLEDVPLEELVQGEEQSAHTGLPRSVGKLRESALMDGDDQTDASWRRVLEAVDAQAAAESTTNDNASSGTGALEFSLRFRFEGFSFALCSQVSAAGGISARSSMDHSWGGDSKDDVSVLTGYSSEGDDLVSSASFDPTNGLDRFGVDGLLSINGRLHRMILSGGLDDIRLTVNGNSGGKKHCSFTLGSVILSSQDSPEPLLSCDALNTEDRSMGGTEDTAIERPEDTSIFAGGSLVVKYVTGGDGDRIQLVEECRSRFARMHVFLHPVAFVDVSEFLTPPLGQLPFRDFGSHPYEEEYTKLVALAGGDADVAPNPQMQYSLSFDGMSISMPLLSGGLVIGQDPPLVLFEFNSTQINSISTATAETGDPSQQRQQRAGSLLDPRKIIDGLSSSSGFRHVN